MFDLFEAAVKVFLARKQEISRERAVTAPKSRLPVLGQAGSDGRVSKATIEAINRHCGLMPYKEDPWFGMDDYYNPPGVSQNRLETKNWSIPYDCDDYAVLAVGLFRACGIVYDKAWVWNLLISPAQPWDLRYCHVICGVEYWDGRDIWTAVIDTNTADSGRVLWFKGIAHSNAVQTAVIQHFNGVYGKQYYKLIRVEYPF